jgi:spermidine synthase
MIPWELLDSAPAPGGGEKLSLYRRGGEFSIRVAGCELMNSRMHGSEDALAELACARIAGRPAPRILIGGLGMGYTTAAALQRLGPDGHVMVAELVPAVVAWNREHLADLAGRPLADPRVTICKADVGRIMQEEHQAYDAILLDVDNGPRGLTRTENNRLYSAAGLVAAREALQPAGVLAVWSASGDHLFTRRLNQAGFRVEEVTVPARGASGGRRHTIWLAVRGS